MSLQRPEIYYEGGVGRLELAAVLGSCNMTWGNLSGTNSCTPLRARENLLRAHFGSTVKRRPRTDPFV
jgi:hypothetical protein